MWCRDSNVIRRSIRFLIGGVIAFFILCSDAYVQQTTTRSKRSISLLHNVKNVDDIDGFNESWDRRSFVGSLVSSAILVPSICHAKESLNFDSLLDLPPIPDGYVRAYLCRHGQTENNRLGKMQGARVDPPINENGISQATSLGRALTRADPSPKVIFHSSLERARLTAETASLQMSSNIDLRELKSLSEVDFGPVADGQPLPLARANMAVTYGAWAVGQIDYRPKGGGDSARDVLGRAAKLLKTLAQEAKSSNGCVAAVTHSSFLRALLGMVLDVPLLEARKQDVNNGGITVIDIKTDGSSRLVERDSDLIGGSLSQAPDDFQLEIPICNVVRVNEARHLPDID